MPAVISKAATDDAASTRAPLALAMRDYDVNGASSSRFSRANYMLRTIGHALGFVSLTVPMWAMHVPWWGWAALAFHGFCWPHLAHWRATRAPNWRPAERLNVIVDHAGGGIWIAAIGFNLVPSVVLSSFMFMDSAICGGLPLVAQGLAAQAAGVLAGVAIFGAVWAPETSQAGILVCLPLLLEHPAAVGLMAYRSLGELYHQRMAMRRLSQRDHLSWLLNRRFWDERIEEEFSRQYRATRRASLILIDLDHFKRVNDLYGHAMGDRVIQRFGERLQAAMRRVDCVCRYGGEEFAILMPDTGPDEAATVMQRIKADIESRPLVDGLHVTASYGVPGLTPLSGGPAAWTKLADETLYRAKELGRDRVLVAEAIAG